MSITAYKVEAVGHDRTGTDYGYVNIMYRYGNKKSCPRPEETTISFGDVSLTLAEKRYIDRSVHPLIGLEFGLPDGYVLYLGSSTWEDIGVVGFGEGADVVIYGSHGPVIKSAPGLVFEATHIYATNELVARSIGAVWIDGRLTVELIE